MQPNFQTTTTAFYPITTLRNPQQQFSQQQNPYEFYSTNNEYLNGSTAADMFSSTFAVLSSSDSNEMNNDEW